jgi:Aspartyl protease
VKKPVYCFLCPWLFALSLPYSIAAQQEQTVRPSTASLEMPFLLYNGYLIVVEGRIGDLTGLKFILDTGVTTSVLDSKIAAKLKLSGRPNHVVTIGKTVPVESSTIPEVQFGPVQARNVEMFIASLNKLSDFAHGVDALIGVDLLQLNNLTLDYPIRNKNQWGQPGNVTRVRFAQDEEERICIRSDDGGLELLFSPAAEYTLVSRRSA